MHKQYFRTRGGSPSDQCAVRPIPALGAPHGQGPINVVRNGSDASAIVRKRDTGHAPAAMGAVGLFTATEPAQQPCGLGVPNVDAGAISFFARRTKTTGGVHRQTQNVARVVARMKPLFVTVFVVHHPQPRRVKDHFPPNVVPHVVARVHGTKTIHPFHVDVFQRFSWVRPWCSTGLTDGARPGPAGQIRFRAFGQDARFPLFLQIGIFATVPGVVRDVYGQVSYVAPLHQGPVLTADRQDKLIVVRKTHRGNRTR